MHHVSIQAAHVLALQVIFGMLGGILAGIVMGCTKTFNNKYKRFIGIYGAGMYA